jgi:hypothetical protein
MDNRRMLNAALASSLACLAACAAESNMANPGATNAGSPGTSSATGTPTSTAPGTTGSGTQQPANAATPAVGTPAAQNPSAQNPATPASTDPNAPASSTKPTLDPKMPLSDIPKECKGFEVLGLKASPGGNVLPNTCAPFDGTYNNPYAIRCVDADPSYKTIYTGDGYCILPPPPELGTQVRVGPDDYSNPGQFELAAGQEMNTSYAINATNADTHYYYRTSWRMRPGSHHMIITVSDTDTADGWGQGGGGFGGGGRSFGGSQRVDQDRPQGTLDVPPENQGIGAQLTAKQQFSFNLHHINSTDKPVLREVWVNIWYMDEKDVTQKMQGLSASGSPLDVSIPAHQETDLQYRCDVTADARIITMLGHRHAHTTRFGIWVKKASGEMVDSYESFHWEDMPTYQYDSVSTNPTPDVPNKVDGASSGQLKLSAGDQLFFECDINNDLDVPLKFANETFTGEMCILFGSYVGANPCSGQATRVK